MSINTPEQKNIEAMMMDVMKQLQKLAPHPDRPEYRGPLFVSLDSSHTPAAEYDGMLGSLMLESVLGAAFSQAVSDNFGSWAGQIDWSNTADCASQYWQERHANSNYTLGSRKVIAGDFNRSALRKHMMQAYLHDLPRRMGLERFLAAYQRKLFALRKQAPAAAFALAA